MCEIDFQWVTPEENGSVGKMKTISQIFRFIFITI